MKNKNEVLCYLRPFSLYDWINEVRKEREINRSFRNFLRKVNKEYIRVVEMWMYDAKKAQQLEEILAGRLNNWAEKQGINTKFELDEEIVEFVTNNEMGKWVEKLNVFSNIKVYIIEESSSFSLDFYKLKCVNLEKLNFILGFFSEEEFKNLNEEGEFLVKCVDNLLHYFKKAGITSLSRSGITFLVNQKLKEAISKYESLSTYEFCAFFSRAIKEIKFLLRKEEMDKLERIKEVLKRLPKISEISNFDIELIFNSLSRFDKEVFKSLFETISLSYSSIVKIYQRKIEKVFKKLSTQRSWKNNNY